jgi:hypothetical protein
MRKLTKTQAKKIRELAHLPQRDIAKRVDVSVSTVNGVLRASAPAKTKRSKPAPKPRAKSAPPAAEGDGEGTPIDRLTRSLAALESAATLAAEDKDVSRMVQVERAVGDITSLITRLTPPPPVDHDASPDMVQAAKDCREAVFGMLERIITEQASS